MGGELHTRAIDQHSEETHAARIAAGNRLRFSMKVRPAQCVCKRFCWHQSANTSSL